MAEDPISFVFGLSMLLIEPMVTRLTRNHADVAKFASLTMLMFGILFLIESLPDFLRSLKLPTIISILAFVVMFVRYGWQFKADLQEIAKSSKVWYVYLFITGAALFAVFFYFFASMSLIEIIYSVNLNTGQG